MTTSFLAVFSSLDRLVKVVVTMQLHARLLCMTINPFLPRFQLVVHIQQLYMLAQQLITQSKILILSFGYQTSDV